MPERSACSYDEKGHGAGRLGLMAPACSWPFFLPYRPVCSLSGLLCCRGCFAGDRDRGAVLVVPVEMPPFNVTLWTEEIDDSRD